MVLALVNLLAENPLLLLFAVTGIGHLLGRIRMGGFSLGVSAILFTGLAAGALHPQLRLPGFVHQFGLILFVYTLGLSAGPAFFTSFRRRGIWTTLLAICSILVAAAITIAVSRALGLPGPVVGGVFVGSLTSTPALAAALEFLSTRTSDPAELALPIVGYSLAYPIGVISVMLTMHWVAKWLRVDVRRESKSLAGSGDGTIVNADIEVTEPTAIGRAICELAPKGRHVVVSRLLRGDRQMTVDGSFILQPGDIVTLVGPQDAVNQFASKIGHESGIHPHFDRSQVDVRRVIVSSREVAGRSLEEIDLRHKFGATVTRIRRGDVDVVPSGEFVLELGDQVRVVAARDRLSEVASFLGNSYKNLGEIDIISISLGIALGLLLGAIPIPLPGGITFKLGFAGGPLLAALVLGYIGRTRSILWILPYNVNVTLRELGIILFLAGVGTQAGNALTGTLSSMGWRVVVAAAIIGFTYSCATLVVGHKLFRIPMTVMYGILAGVQTQSATIAFASERAGSDAPNIPYAMVYPTAMVLKILLVQVLVATLGLK